MDGWIMDEWILVCWDFTFSSLFLDRGWVELVRLHVSRSERAHAMLNLLFQMFFFVIQI
jgi:hypothetical protein